MKRIGLALAAVLSASAAAAAPIEASRLSAHVKVLASDAFEGRGPGTPGEDKTVAYIAQQFQAAGAEPAGENGGWTQAVAMKRFTLEAAPRIAFAGAPAACLKSAPASVIVWSRRSGARAVAVEGAPLVFAGFGVSAPDQDWDDFAGVDLRGKVAVVFMNDPDYRKQTGPFSGAAMSYYGRWTYKVEELARRGAAGVLMIHEEATTGLGWPLVQTVYTQPTIDIERGPGERLAFEGWIGFDAAKALFACAGRDLEAERAKAETGGFRAGPLGALSLDAAFTYRTDTTTTRNVVARVRGSSHPEESVLYTAHWDHMGRAGPDVTGDDIYNGALDNAGGVAGLLELARAFGSGPRPQRSIVFLATTLEEQGLLGAEYYAAHPLHDLARTAGGLNMDAVNLFGPVPNMVAAGYGKTDLQDRLEAEVKAAGRRLEPNPNDAIGFYFRSDHFPFVKQGVPMLFPGSGWDIADRLPNTRDPKIGTRFHQPSDEWGPDLDFNSAAADIDIYHRVGLKLANSRDWPGWNAGAEFKAVREASAAARR